MFQRILAFAAVASAVACSANQPTEPKSSSTSHLNRTDDIVAPDQPEATELLPPDVGEGAGGDVALTDPPPASSDDDTQLAGILGGAPGVCTKTPGGSTYTCSVRPGTTFFDPTCGGLCFSPL